MTVNRTTSRKNTPIVALINFDDINNTHKIHINAHDTTSKPIKRVETDINSQGIPNVDNTFTEKN